MPQISSKQFENFGDGLLTICEADERSLTRTKLEHIRYGNRTVGVTRYWKARTAGNKVDKLLAIPLAAGILAPVGFILSPAVGAAIMSLSTIVVALNAMTLHLKRA